MAPDLLIALGAVFVAVALASGSLASFALSRSAPGRRRLEQIAGPAGSDAGHGQARLTDLPSATYQRLSTVIPRSPKEMSRLRLRLATAGYRRDSAVIAYALVELLAPVALAGLTIYQLGWENGWLPALFLAVLGYLLPGLWLGRQINLRKKQIRNGLPDALDLLIVCIEAGSGIDQAILRVSQELELAYPALAEELRLITTETRAGKPRLEAFRNFAERTKVEDVRSLVAMLVQTDRFGTSIGQALRTHAEVARTKRRQRAEERAGKLGVKLVFPLVFFLFPAFYVVVLGPMVIRVVRVFFGEFIG